MNKAYTYADFITESMNYQHSQEHYGFMKEMAEIELMESYLASQQFLAEEAGYYDFAEGVLMETGDTDSVKTKLGEKAKNLIKKIVEAIKKAFGVFIKFITSIPGKVKSLIDKITGSKAEDDLLFVVGSAESDPSGTEEVFNQVITGSTGSESVSTDILKKRFSEIIAIPDIYEGWHIGTSEDPFNHNYIYDFESIYSRKMFEEFTKVTKALIDYINNGDGVINVTFKMKSDHNKLDKPVNISYLSIYIAVGDILVMTKLKDMDKVFDKVKEELATPNGRNESSVSVSLTSSINEENKIKALEQNFTEKMDSLFDYADRLHRAFNSTIDPKELKYFNEINQLLQWAFSEYMAASNHAFKLITDIVKVSAKIKAAYEKREKENQSATS